MKIKLQITKSKGSQAVAGFNGDICGKDCRMAINKKYKLAYLSNCNFKANGKNVIIEYFDVLIKFVTNSFSFFSTLA